MSGWHRLLPLASIVDRFSQDRYRIAADKLLVKSGINLEGSPLWISPRAYFDIAESGSITLSEGCVISHYVALLTHDFSMDRAAVQILGPRSDNKEYSRKASIHIGKNAFLGLHAILLPGVRIGAGAIVGAGSVVTKNVPENGIVAGNPAQLLGYTHEGIESRLQKFELNEKRP